MPKPILILGPGRTGKTTLARLLRAELPTYNLLHADALRAAIMKQLPSQYPQELLHYEKNSHYANLLLELVHEQLQQDHYAQGVILDGGVISPTLLASHSFMSTHQPIVVFLGHGDLDAEGIFNLIRANDTTSDWSSELDDASLRAKTAHFAKQNRSYRDQCTTTNLRYIDTSQDRPTILTQLKQEIIRNL